jgi:hypothetical protein
MASVRVPCLLCGKKDSVQSLPIIGGYVVQCCEGCAQKSLANADKVKKSKKPTDLCSQCYYNKAKRSVLYRDQRIATLYTKLERATQLIAEKDVSFTFEREIQREFSFACLRRRTLENFQKHFAFFFFFFFFFRTLDRAATSLSNLSCFPFVLSYLLFSSAHHSMKKPNSAFSALCRSVPVFTPHTTISPVSSHLRVAPLRH